VAVYVAESYKIVQDLARTARAAVPDHKRLQSFLNDCNYLVILAGGEKELPWNYPELLFYVLF
jgi:hypothetical protein